MISVPVVESSQVADVRRRASVLSHTFGFDETAAGRVAIAVTELATNLVKYGASGEILLGTFDDETGAGLEVIALDKGPGFSNIPEMMRDGHSTGGSAGTGLGAIQRQTQAFDIASWPGRGTTILARFVREAKSGKARAGETFHPLFGGVAIPLRGEIVCGDAFATRSDANGWTMLLADGLGHGTSAAQASNEAVRLFHASETDDPSEILAAVHAGLRHTRGAAVSVARYEADRAAINFAGIGNVAGAIVLGGEIKRTVSLVGTAGHVARRIQSFTYPFPPSSSMIMCSDGIATSWSLAAYPGLLGAHPSVVAAVIYRDFARGRDDAAVLVARNNPL